MLLCSARQLLHGPGTARLAGSLNTVFCDDDQRMCAVADCNHVPLIPNLHREAKIVLLVVAVKHFECCYVIFDSVLLRHN